MPKKNSLEFAILNTIVLYSFRPFLKSPRFIFSKLTSAELLIFNFEG